MVIFQSSFFFNKHRADFQFDVCWTRLDKQPGKVGKWQISRDLQHDILLLIFMSILQYYGPLQPYN